MKLSEAIRLGAMSCPQARGFARNDATGGRCALGAALFAVGTDTWDYTLALCQFPVTSDIARNPVTGEMAMLLSVIRCLNDGEMWTREQIAAWVETLEPPQKADAVDPHGDAPAEQSVHARL